MRKYLILSFIFFTFFSKAQLLDKTAVNISYRYSGRNVLQAGLEYRFGDSYEGSIIIGPSMLYTHMNQTDKFIPEANINFLRFGQLFGISANPYSLEPRWAFHYSMRYFSILAMLFLFTGKNILKG